MTNNLYDICAYRTFQEDLDRGTIVTRTEYTDDAIVVADTPEKANEKFLDYFYNHKNSRGWKILRNNELQIRKELPLKTRLEILGEVLEVIK